DAGPDAEVETEPACKGAGDAAGPAAAHRSIDRAGGVSDRGIDGGVGDRARRCGIGNRLREPGRVNARSTSLIRLAAPPWTAPLAFFELNVFIQCSLFTHLLE